MPPTRYSLHYEDYSEHMMSRFGKLLQMQSLVDMTLMCNSHTLRVHKAVLAACSVYFQEVLQKQSGEPLIILKMRFSVLKCLVEFMYCGKTQCAEDNLDELMSAAQFLKIKGLSKVTKEDLGIKQTSELPAFTPPVVINRPPPKFSMESTVSADMPTFAPPVVIHRPPNPQATFEAPPRPQFHIDEISSKEHVPMEANPLGPSSVPVSTAGPAADNRPANDQDTIVRIPFNIEKGNNSGLMKPTASPYPEAAGPRPKGKKARVRNMQRVAGAWESGSALGRAAGRALMRREHDSRKAIHHLKHLQSRHMQDYMSMEQVSLSHAVNSICGPDPPPYLNMDSDLYMDQPPRLDTPLPYKEPNETVTSSYTTSSSSSLQNESNNSANKAMSQYVNALKNAGLPTDLPILFESGDGSYINVNEQVLLDMVQSSEIQYEVIEQPNIIEKVNDPSEIKSIDDLSKSIKKGEMMMGYNANYKNDHQYANNTISGLPAMLPDNLESYGEHHNFVVLDQPLQEANNMDTVNTNDFCDMNFFTKSMSDDVKKYYHEPPMDNTFSMPLLDEKNGNVNQQYGDDMRRNVCYDFGLQGNDFKEDALDCLMAPTPKRDDEDQFATRAQEKEKIIQDLINIEKQISQKNTQEETDFAVNIKDFVVYKQEDKSKDAPYSSELNEWDSMGMSQDDQDETSAGANCINDTGDDMSRDYNESVMDLTDSTKKIQLDNVDFAKDNQDYDKANIDYDRVNEDYNRGNEDYNRGNEDYDRVNEDYNRGNEDYNRGNEDYDRVNGDYGRVNTDYDRVDDDYDKENAYFGKNIEDYDKQNVNIIIGGGNMMCNNGSPVISVGNMIRNAESPLLDVGDMSSNIDVRDMIRNDIPFAVGLLPMKETCNELEDPVLKRKHSAEDFLDDDDAKCLKRKVKYKKL